MWSNGRRVCVWRRQKCYTPHTENEMELRLGHVARTRANKRRKLVQTPVYSNHRNHRAERRLAGLNFVLLLESHVELVHRKAAINIPWKL
jgi:hypothetical protein